MSDDWADAINDFGEAVARALEAGVTVRELKDEIDRVKEEV